MGEFIIALFAAFFCGIAGWLARGKIMLTALICVCLSILGLAGLMIWNGLRLTWQNWPEALMIFVIPYLIVFLMPCLGGGIIGGALARYVNRRKDHLSPASQLNPTQKHWFDLVWLLLGLVVGVLSIVSVIRTLHTFYIATASLAPGTAVRPMGVTLALGLTWTLSIVAGGICSMIAIVLFFRRRNWRCTGIAVLSAILCWLPMFISFWGYHYIIELRKLVDEP